MGEFNESGFERRFNNDPDCSDIRHFIPIKLELIELFKYWYTKFIEHEFDSCVISMSMHEHFVSWLSAMRGNQITDLLAEDEIKRAIAEAQERLKKSGYWLTREKDWDIFFHGTEEQKQELVRRLQRAFLHGEK